MRGLLIALLVLLLPGGARAQERALLDAAARAQSAWLTHDVGSLVADSPGLLLQLPGADPSTPLGPPQAAALLADFLASAEEVELVLRAAREVEPGRGYVELVRRYRVAGTQAVRRQLLLLGYRRAGPGWGLVELRVVQ